MSRIACVWADLGVDNAANQWYEETHVPAIVAKLDTGARHGEPAEDKMFKEVASIDGTHMTIYDLPNDQDAKDLDVKIQPAVDKLPGDARLDTRCYKEFASWHGEYWQGDVNDVQMWIIVLWQPNEDVHDQFVDWFKEEFAPGMLECPELLRTRIFELENASLVVNNAHEQKDPSKIYRYLTFWEFDCDDLPWEILVYLGSSERWRYYVESGHLSWQIEQYLEHGRDNEDESNSSVSSKADEKDDSDSISKEAHRRHRSEPYVSV
ncbi:hypothetical protein ACN47E_009258 [Coniothyrium glycines]